MAGLKRVFQSIQKGRVLANKPAWLMVRCTVCGAEAGQLCCRRKFWGVASGFVPDAERIATPHDRRHWGVGHD